MDADITYRLYKQLRPQIDKDYKYVFYDVIMPLCKTLIDVKANGINFDINHANKMITENDKVMNAIEIDFIKEVGYEININSPVQLVEYVYKKLKMKPDKRFMTAKNQLSVDEKALKFYSEKAPSLKKILEYRKVQKQTSTYLEGFKNFRDPETGRLYPDYLQFSTATGRLSAIDPAIQTVPRDNRIRNVIIPSEKNKLIVVDLSQIELRVLAMVADDQAMIRAFNSGHDFHSYTACIMFGIDINKFDKKIKEHGEKRDAAKTINFGLIYLRGPKALADQLKISVNKAEEFMSMFFSAYPNVNRWMAQTKAFAVHHGYVENIYGRKRYLPKIKSSINEVREEALRQSINTPIQSSASDIFAHGFIRSSEWIKKEKLKTMLVGTVHDSILLDSPPEEAEYVSTNVVRLMTKDIPRVTIELKADVDILDRWNK